MNFEILGLGTAVPATLLDAGISLAVARSLSQASPEQGTWLEDVVAGSGIKSRRIVLGSDLVNDLCYGTRASGSPFLPTEGEVGGPSTGERLRHYARLAWPLALEAASNALRQSGMKPEDIVHLVTVSCTGFAAPGVDCRLIEELGLSRSVNRTNVGFMGCHGALNGLRVARGLAATGGAVLLVAVELCSVHYHYDMDPGQLIANALFADGAAAIVGRSADHSNDWQLVGNGGCIVPDSAAAMTWIVGDSGFEMTLGRQVPGLIGRYLGPWLREWLERQGLSITDIATWAVHPGGPRILDAVEQALALPEQSLAVSRAVLAEHGNMSSPTLLFILEKLMAAKAPTPCVMLGFGPGLAVEAALFR